MAGMVASVHYLFTRERKPFASLVLEDLDGAVEVIVWPRVYTETKDLWQEGSILLVEGKVRIKDDRVQLNCERARPYQPEAAGEEEEIAPRPSETPAVAEVAAPPGRRPPAGRSSPRSSNATFGSIRAGPYCYVLERSDSHTKRRAGSAARPILFSPPLVSRSHGRAG